MPKREYCITCRAFYPEHEHEHHEFPIQAPFLGFGFERAEERAFYVRIVDKFKELEDAVQNIAAFTEELRVRIDNLYGDEK